MILQEFEIKGKKVICIPERMTRVCGELVYLLLGSGILPMIHFLVVNLRCAFRKISSAVCSRDEVAVNCTAILRSTG